MRTPVAPLALVACSAFALAACGSDGADDATDQLPDADALIDEATERGISPLALAFDQTATATAFQMEMTMGMSMDIGFGEAMEFAADPSQPMITAQYDAAGQQHMLMDMGAITRAAGAGDVFGDATGMEMWFDGTTMYADYGSMGSMMSAAGIGIPEGIFTVDLAGLGESVAGADIARSVTGQAMPDPVEMANVLGEVLADVEGDGSSYRGTIDFFEYSQAMGQDPADLTGGLGDLDGLVAADAVLAAFETIEVAVEVELDGDAVDTVRFDIDMAPLFAAMIEAFGDDAQAMGDMFVDATFTMEMLMNYDIDPTIDVQIPQGDFPDITSDFAELLNQGGPFG